MSMLKMIAACLLLAAAVLSGGVFGLGPLEDGQSAAGVNAVAAGPKR
jgi:hypothetical protein